MNESILKILMIDILYLSVFVYIFVRINDNGIFEKKCTFHKQVSYIFLTLRF